MQTLNDHLIELRYTSHFVVLLAIAILDADDEVSYVRTGRIKDVTNRLVTETRERSQIETSLRALYGDDEAVERGEAVRYIDRRPAKTGNAYDWYPTAQGRELLAVLEELGVIEVLAESGLTADV